MQNNGLLKYEFSQLPTCDENISKKSELYPDVGNLLLRKRYYVVLLTLCSVMLNFLLRINLSICIVDMTSDKTVIIDNVTYVEPAEYNWTNPEKGFILSSFAWGMFLGPLGPLVADRIGGVTTIGYAVLIAASLTILSPVVLLGGPYIYMFVRILEGTAHAVCASCLYIIFVHWGPPNERSRLVNIVTLGMPLGILTAYPISGFISYWLGWKFVFYITGGVCALWFCIWTLTVADTPENDRFITKMEKNFLTEINRQQDSLVKTVRHPWKHILTSKATLAYLNERFVESWSLSFLMSCLPLYIKDVYPSNVKDIGIFSALPQFCSICSLIGGSFLQDYLRTKGINPTKLHKSFILFGQIGAIITLLIASQWVDFHVTMTAFCIFKIGFSIAEVSYYVLPVDLVLQQASVLMSITITIMSIGYLFNPIIMGFMVQNHLYSEWSRYFLFLGSFNIWGAIIFAKYGSGELEAWVQKIET